MKTVTVWVTLIAMAAALLVGGVGGWVVKGWKDGAAATVDAKADAKAATDTYNQMLASVTRAAQDLQAKNASNETAMQTLAATIGKQTYAIDILKTQYASLVVGSCAFNADGDSLLQQSYQAASPAGPAKAR